MGSITKSKNITLCLGQQKYVKTIPLDKNLNIGLTWAVPGDEKFTAYMATMLSNRVDQIRAFVSDIIQDDKNADDNASMQPRDPVQAPDTDEGD